MSLFRDDMTIARARRVLEENLDNGTCCPTCGRTAKRRAKPLSGAPARAVLEMFTHHGQGWVHVQTLAARHLADVATQGGYLTFAHHWGLIEAKGGEHSQGWWRVTDKGVAWLRGDLRVPSHVFIFNNEVHGRSETLVGPGDALSTPFDMAALERLHAPKIAPAEYVTGQLWNEAA